MLLEPVFKLFAEQVPVCVGVRGIMEWALSAEAVDGLFGRVADEQYERELLFSTCVDLMATVVCRTHKSVNVAYQRAQPAVGVSVQALYDKLKGIEPQTSAELVRHTAQRLGAVDSADERDIARVGRGVSSPGVGRQSFDQDPATAQGAA